MPARMKLSVSPRGDGGWEVASGRSTLSTHRTKQAAVAAGRRQAKRQAPSQLTIKGSNGRIQDQRAYESGGSGRSTTRRKPRTGSKRSSSRATRPASRSGGRKASGSKRSTSPSKRSSRGSTRGRDQKVSEIMTPNPRTLPMTATVGQAAEAMRLIDAGTVLVADDSDRLIGIVTDRDIAIRAVAEGRDPLATTVGDISSPYPTVIEPDTSVREAVKLMRELNVRRLPVVEGDRPVGVVSLGDLAILRDPSSVLADISAAPSTDSTARPEAEQVARGGTMTDADPLLAPSVLALEDIEFGDMPEDRLTRR